MFLSRERGVNVIESDFNRMQHKLVDEHLAGLSRGFGFDDIYCRDQSFGDHLVTLNTDREMSI